MTDRYRNLDYSHSTPIWLRLRCQVCGNALALAGSPGKVAHMIGQRAWRFLANGRSLCPKCKAPRRAPREGDHDE